MRRIFAAIFCLLALATSVSAAGTVTQLESTTQVSTDGGCQVSIVMQLSMDTAPEELDFPLPKSARNVRLNGHGIRAPLQGDHRVADLTQVVPGAGIYTVTLQYSLPDSVSNQNGNLVLQIELLGGFSCPIQDMSFTVELPSQPEHRPSFSSTYYQDTADSIMDLSIANNTISGTLTQSLRDRESLTMTLKVSGETFHQSFAKQWKLDTNDVLMILLAALATVYWLLSMPCLPPRRSRKAQEPEGLTAGELGCCLTGQGVDLTMLVLSWAQLGYVLIEKQNNGRVLLHKRMDMGNERSEFEVRCFQTLFGKRDAVDGTGAHYARLCQRAARTVPNIREYYHRRSGNPKILRGSCLAMGFLAGISLALAFANDTLWQILLSIPLGALTTAVSFAIQQGTKALHLRRRGMLWAGLLGSLLWLCLGIRAGEWSVALTVLLFQWLFGLAAAYGGRRSELGRQYMSQILGLRRHLCRISTWELQRILQQNPDYYYALAPYAMALGVDRAFARQLGKQRLAPCTYLTAGTDAQLTAREWNGQLRSIVEAMDARQRRLIRQRLFGKG